MDFFSLIKKVNSHGSVGRSAQLSGTGKAAGISGESGSQGSEAQTTWKEMIALATPPKLALLASVIGLLSVS